jgi:hypothetical protein
MAESIRESMSYAAMKYKVRFYAVLKPIELEDPLHASLARSEELLNKELQLPSPHPNKHLHDVTAFHIDYSKRWGALEVQLAIKTKSSFICHLLFSKLFKGLWPKGSILIKLMERLFAEAKIPLVSHTMVETVFPETLRKPALVRKGSVVLFERPTKDEKGELIPEFDQRFLGGDGNGDDNGEEQLQQHGLGGGQEEGGMECRTADVDGDEAGGVSGFETWPGRRRGASEEEGEQHQHAASAASAAASARTRPASASTTGSPALSASKASSKMNANPASSVSAKYSAVPSFSSKGGAIPATTTNTEEEEKEEEMTAEQAYQRMKEREQAKRQQNNGQHGSASEPASASASAQGAVAGSQRSTSSTPAAASASSSAAAPPLGTGAATGMLSRQGGRLLEIDTNDDAEGDSGANNGGDDYQNDEFETHSDLTLTPASMNQGTGFSSKPVLRSINSAKSDASDGEETFGFSAKKPSFVKASLVNSASQKALALVRENQEEFITGSALDSPVGGAGESGASVGVSTKSESMRKGKAALLAMGSVAAGLQFVRNKSAREDASASESDSASAGAGAGAPRISQEEAMRIAESGPTRSSQRSAHTHTTAGSGAGAGAGAANSSPSSTTSNGRTTVTGMLSRQGGRNLSVQVMQLGEEEEEEEKKRNGAAGDDGGGGDGSIDQRSFEEMENRSLRNFHSPSSRDNHTASVGFSHSEDSEGEGDDGDHIKASNSYSPKSIGSSKSIKNVAKVAQITASGLNFVRQRARSVSQVPDPHNTVMHKFQDLALHGKVTQSAKNPGIIGLAGGVKHGPDRMLPSEEMRKKLDIGLLSRQNAKKGINLENLIDDDGEDEGDGGDDMDHMRPPPGIVLGMGSRMGSNARTTAAPTADTTTAAAAAAVAASAETVASKKAVTAEGEGEVQHKTLHHAPTIAQLLDAAAAAAAAVGEEGQPGQGHRQLGAAGGAGAAVVQQTPTPAAPSAPAASSDAATASPAGTSRASTGPAKTAKASPPTATAKTVKASPPTSVPASLTAPAQAPGPASAAASSAANAPATGLTPIIAPAGASAASVLSPVIPSPGVSTPAANLSSAPSPSIFASESGSSRRASAVELLQAVRVQAASLLTDIAQGSLSAENSYTDDFETEARTPASKLKKQKSVLGDLFNTSEYKLSDDEEDDDE